MLKSIKRTNLVILSLIVLMICFITIYTFKNINVNNIITEIKDLPFYLKILTMTFFITLQIVVAFLPGEPLELASGYIFGAWSGTLICLLGSAIGTIIVYYLVRIFQHTIIERMFKQDKLAEVKKVLSSKKSKFWLFIIFLIPGSPKDIMTYLGSLTGISLKFWLLLTTIGRIPSIITSTYLAEAIKGGNVVLAVLIFFITILLVLGGIIYYKKIINEGE